MNICAPIGDTATRPSARAAFTLTETLVAGATLAVAAVSLYAGISFGVTSVGLARQNLRATHIALEKMEIVRMYSWEQVNSNGFVPLSFTAPFFPSTGTDTNGGLTFYGQTVITNAGIATSYGSDMRRVDVTVIWTNRNIEQSVQMSTYLSQYGMQRYIN